MSSMAGAEGAIGSTFVCSNGFSGAEASSTGSSCCSIAGSTVVSS